MVKAADVQECLDEYTPENPQIVNDILEKGTEAKAEEVIEAVRKIPNLKRLRGKVPPSPFILALTTPPINMCRLDAKFIAQMHKDRKNPLNADAKGFLKSLGFFMPPEEELA